MKKRHDRKGEMGIHMPNRKNDLRTARIAALGTAVPPCRVEQASCGAYLAEHYRRQLSEHSLDVLRQVFSHPSIRSRHFAVDDLSEIVDETQDRKIDRFTRWSIKLSSQAIRQALKRASLDPAEVSALIVNTCTGYVCPGLTAYLIEEVGFRGDLKAYDLVGMGCGGAIPNLQMARAHVESFGGVVVSCAVEICTATFQMGDDPGLIVSNALFGDGAAAAVVWDRPGGAAIVASSSVCCPENREDLRYVYRNGQLHNRLSIRLPRIVAPVIANLLRAMLASEGLTAADIRYWAFHSGGSRIIDEVRNTTALPEESFLVTRDVLAEFGNMSSPTVLFILDRIQRAQTDPGAKIVLSAFGTGMSAHAMLLE